MLSIVYQHPLDLLQLHKMIQDTRSSCTCRPLLWSRDNTIASHLAGQVDPRSGQFFCWSFSSTLRQMMGKLMYYQSPDNIGHQTLLFKAVPIDDSILSLHFVASFCCRPTYMGKNCFLHKQLLTPRLPVASLVCKLNGNSCHYFLIQPL